MKTKQQKIDLVTEIKDKLGKSRSVVFTDYQGLTMPQLQELRRNLKDQQSEFTITKNTMLKIALKEVNYPALPDDVMIGPIATLFAYQDEVAPIKILVKALKDASLGKVKAGFLGQDLLDASSVTKLASLPSKLELQEQVVGVLAAPLLGMVNVLQGNLRNLVYVVDSIRKQKSSFAPNGATEGQKGGE